MTLLTRLIDDQACRIEVQISAATERVISRIGRTEDIRFSPKNDRLAIACFLNNTCLLLDIKIDRSNAKPVIQIHDYLELHSDAIKQPHGLDFIDDDTVIIANRDGVVTVFDIPLRCGKNRIFDVKPTRSINRASLRHKIRSPGSVCVLKSGKGKAEILVCNNYKHRITHHIFHVGHSVGFTRSRMLLGRGLLIPDGIAVSPDAAWIAVSNHQTRSVLLFDARKKMSPLSEPSGMLFGVAYPHGVRFSSDGRRIFVADAGAPYVHVYEAQDSDWSGEHDPMASVLVLDDATFLKGRHNPQEGGPKGIDVYADIMVLTCEEQPLSFFHLPTLLE